MPNNTLYEAVGSSAGVLRFARAWHERVLADDIVAHAFRHGFHPQHTERLAVVLDDIKVSLIRDCNSTARDEWRLHRIIMGTDAPPFNVYLSLSSGAA